MGRNTVTSRVTLCVLLCISVTDVSVTFSICPNNNNCFCNSQIQIQIMTTILKLKSKTTAVNNNLTVTNDK